MYHVPHRIHVFLPVRKRFVERSGAPDENIVQNYLNIALLNVF